MKDIFETTLGKPIQIFLWLANPINIQSLNFGCRWLGINSLLQKMSG